MNPDIKAKWVEALESGEYEQGRKVLHNETANTYCCLGVLCAIAEDEGVITPTGTHDAYVEWDDENGEIVREPATSYNGSYAALPPEVVEWSGISNDLGEFIGDDGHATTLTYLNDAERRDFKAIANVIKEKF